MLVTKRPLLVGAEKPLNAFETLTLAPIDRRLDRAPDLLDGREIGWLNAYHAHVREMLTPLVDPATAEWLARGHRPAGAALSDIFVEHHAPKSNPGNRDDGHTPWRLLALLMSMTAIGSMSMNFLVPAVPRLVDFLASDAETIQLTISLYMLGLALAQLLTGPLSDRFGRRPVILAGFSLATCASLAAIAASNAPGLIVARVSAGDRRRHRCRH